VRIPTLIAPLALCVTLASAGQADPRVIRAGESRDAGTTAAFQWRSWDDGLREASASKRPVLVDVYTDWCGWCKRMDRDVYSRDDVREYLARNFVTVKLNAESQMQGTYEGRVQSSSTIARRFGVRGYPTSVFLRPGGEHLVNVGGYVAPERFLLVLRYIGEGHMDRGTPWETFAKQASGSGN